MHDKGMAISKDPTIYPKEAGGADFPESRELFNLAFKVYQHRLGISDPKQVSVMDIYRGAGYSGSFSRHWRQGKENFTNIIKMFKLSEFLKIDPLLCMEILQGKISAEEAFELAVSKTTSKKFRQQREKNPEIEERMVMNFSDRLRLKITKIIEEGALSREDYFDTREVSELFTVSQRTVQWWIDTNKMECHKTSGGHSRLSYDNIIEFIESRGVFNPLTMYVNRRMLVIDSTAARRQYEKALNEYKAVDIYQAETAEAGLILSGQIMPEFVLIGGDQKGIRPQVFIDGVATQDRWKPSLLIVVAPESHHDKMIKAGATHCIERPVQRDKLLQLVREEEKKLLSRPRRVRKVE
jgi:excisionase family DNA binding protein